MAKIALGCKRIVVPIYILSGVVMVIDHATPGIAVGLVGILVFMVGALIQILGKVERNRICLLEKIDQSVGKVWDAGGRAERRRIELESASRPLAAVRDLVPRR